MRLIIWVVAICVGGPLRACTDQNYSETLTAQYWGESSPSPSLIDLQMWANFPSQTTPTTGMRRFQMQASTSNCSAVMPIISITNRSRLAIELHTTASGNVTEVHMFPDPIPLDEWLFMNVVISSGPTRNISTTIVYADQSRTSARQLLQGDLLRLAASRPTRTRPPVTVEVVISYLSVIDDSSPDDDIESGRALRPNQAYSDLVRSGGQSFEGTSLAIACLQPGFLFTSIEFASFGRPYGVYPGFRMNPDCHSNLTMEVVRRACLGASSCSTTPDIALFGEPCLGHRKSLAVLAACGPPHDAVVAESNSSTSQTRLELAQAEFLQGVNVSMQIVLRQSSDDSVISAVLDTFVVSFCSKFNVTSNRIIYKSLTPLRLPLMLLSFTLVPPMTADDDSGTSRQLAKAFQADIQLPNTPLRRISSLEAAEPPVPVTISDVNLGVCNGEYVFMSKQQSCQAYAASAQSTDFVYSVRFTIAATAAGFLLGIGFAVVLWKFREAWIRHTRSQNQAPVESDNNLDIAVSAPPDSTEPVVLSKSIAENIHYGNQVSQQKKSIKGIPMHTDRLTVLTKQSQHGTDIDTDSGTFSDANNLSIESGPARVDVYFTDSN